MHTSIGIYKGSRSHASNYLTCLSHLPQKSDSLHHFFPHLFSSPSFTTPPHSLEGVKKGFLAWCNTPISSFLFAALFQFRFLERSFICLTVWVYHLYSSGTRQAGRGEGTNFGGNTGSGISQLHHIHSDCKLLQGDLPRCEF